MTASPIPPSLPGLVRRPPSNLIPPLLLLSSGRRTDSLLFAGWCRAIDDLTDDPGIEEETKRSCLEAWFTALAPGRESDLPEDLRDLILRRHLDRSLLQEIVLGMMMDLGHVRHETFAGLETYCRRVASAVGLVSIGIFGAQGPVAESYADQLGVALQLTNILRDVAEDAAMDRIYLPQEDLKRFGVSEQEILHGIASPAMTHLLHHQAERADSWFANAETSWIDLSVNQRRLLRPARLMSAIYRELLLSMHRDRYDVLAKRYRVSTPRKLALLLRVMTARS